MAQDFLNIQYSYYNVKIGQASLEISYTEYTMCKFDKNGRTFCREPGKAQLDEALVFILDGNLERVAHA